MTNYLIRKLAEPEDMGAAYAGSLERLSGTEEDLTPDLDVIVKLREMTEDEAAKVAARPHVIHVEEDKPVYVPEPPEVSTDASASATMDAVQRYHGFDKAYAKGLRGEGRRVAILDTGLAQAWADKLGARVVAKESMISGEDWRDSQSSHGTWTATWIALSAPQAAVIIIKVLSTRDGSGSFSGIISGINRGVALGATEISQSLGGPGDRSDSVAAAVDAARARGVLMPCSAGNAQRGTTGYTADQQTPGAADGAITVGAGDIDGNLADFSSWGNAVDIRAVGVNSQSGDLSGGLTSYMSGTSMSCPVVAAACAVLGSGKGREAASQIEKAMYSTTGDTTLPPYQEGAGILDVEYASAKMVVAPPAPAPSPSTMMVSKFREIPVKDLRALALSVTSRGAAVGNWKGKEA